MNTVSQIMSGIAILLLVCYFSFRIITSPGHKPQPDLYHVQDSLLARIIEVDSLLDIHSNGALATRYEYGRAEPVFNHRWHITNDSLYTCRREATNRLNIVNSRIADKNN